MWRRLRSRLQPNGHKEMVSVAARRCAAPFPGPAAPGHGGAWSAVELTPERQAEGPLSPAPWRRAGWAPAASGAGWVCQGAVPLGIGSQQDVQHGCFRGRSGCSSCCSLSGFVACRRGDRQTCRVGLVMVRGQFRFGHRSPWMAAATMAARLHSSSTASARIAVSMARPSPPIHHSM